MFQSKLDVGVDWCSAYWARIFSLLNPLLNTCSVENVFFIAAELRYHIIIVVFHVTNNAFIFCVPLVLQIQIPDFLDTPQNLDRSISLLWPSNSPLDKNVHHDSQDHEEEYQLEDAKYQEHHHDYDKASVLFWAPFWLVWIVEGYAVEDPKGLTDFLHHNHTILN